MSVLQYLTRTFGGGEMSKVSPQMARELNLSCSDCANRGICIYDIRNQDYFPATHLVNYGCEQFILSQNVSKEIKEVWHKYSVCD